jgi:hypothetical protein
MSYIDPADAISDFILHSPDDVAWWTVYLRSEDDYDSIILKGASDLSNLEWRARSRRVRRVVIETFPEQDTYVNLVKVHTQVILPGSSFFPNAHQLVIRSQAVSQMWTRTVQAYERDTIPGGQYAFPVYLALSGRLGQTKESMTHLDFLLSATEVCIDAGSKDEYYTINTSYSEREFLAFQAEVLAPFQIKQLCTHGRLGVSAGKLRETTRGSLESCTHHINHEYWPKQPTQELRTAMILTPFSGSGSGANHTATPSLEPDSESYKYIMRHLQPRFGSPSQAPTPSMILTGFSEGEIEALRAEALSASTATTPSYLLYEAAVPGASCRLCGTKVRRSMSTRRQRRGKDNVGSVVSRQSGKVKSD